MKHVRFNGPVGHRLLAYGHEIFGGKSVEMSDEEAAQLAADPHVDVTVTATAAKPEADTGEGRTRNPKKER